jgi:CheY-like chemotaxis protein
VIPNVLLVDDEQVILEGIRRQLGDGFNVKTATSGPAALALIAKNPDFQVIVADMNMPEMSGIDFLRRASKINTKAVLMMLTGDTQRKTAEEAVDLAHVFHFITKPCSAETIVSAVQAAVDLYHLQKKIDRIRSDIQIAA